MIWKLIKYFPGDNGKTTCKLCGTIHTHQYWLENEEGEEIEVGSECARKLLAVKQSELKELAMRTKIKQEQKLKIIETDNYIEISGKPRKVMSIVSRKYPEYEKNEISRGYIQIYDTMYIKLSKE